MGYGQDVGEGARSDLSALEEAREYDYVIVGSGAGGGTLGARLAERGATVLILEAGADPLGRVRAESGDPGRREGADAGEPDRRAGADAGDAVGLDGSATAGLPGDYEVPAFSAFATENPAMKWDFYVRHYADDARQRRDPKYRERWTERDDSGGVLYPRAGCLGGCTAHNAMITVYPHNADWEHIRQLTGDPSWSAESMRGYFERLEECRHRPIMRFLAKLGFNPSRHGWSGWLPTEVAMPMGALDDEPLAEILRDAVRTALTERAARLKRIIWELFGRGDPNDWRLVRDDAFGIRYQPLATRDHARVGARERIVEVMASHADRLFVKLNCLATRVLFDADNRAVGVEFLEGPRLYGAHAQPSGLEGVPGRVRARREVILAGGAFNTPQLLLLSGIGPADELARHGIPVRHDLPGVGSNLQDRYEVGVVNRMRFSSWEVLHDADFSADDPLYKEWSTKRKGMYTSNGAVISVIRRSAPERPLPDLFCFAILGDFRGYYPGYSARFRTEKNYLTWVILKAHANNRAGTVRLRSADPRDTPVITFHSFDEGTDDGGEDVRSVVDGIEFVRRLTRSMIEDGWITEEELPGGAVTDRADLERFVKDHAWGHHASCSCPIGDPGDGGVVDGDFRVHGVSGLRIVDASVFPKIPGFFIVSSVYTIAEKAADVMMGVEG